MKLLKNNFLGFIIGGIIFGSIGITIAYQINANQISYGDTNVASALTELYEMSDTYINYTKGANGGETILLDPTGNIETCTTYDSKTEQKSGCMRFYIYAEDKNNYYAILDHNTTAVVADCPNDNCWKKAQTQVIEDTEFWLPIYQARNITADEIYNITKELNTCWRFNSSKYGYWCDLDNIEETTEISKYAFLYENLVECKKFGCNIEDNNMYNSSSIWGYWLSSLQPETSNAYLVHGHGVLYVNEKNEPINGVRPVITISKS